MRLAIFLLVVAAAAAAAPDAADLVKLKRQRILDRFFQSIEARSDFDAQTKAKILALREGAVLEGEYGVIHQTLLLTNEEYRRADALLQGERFAAASEILARLKTSTDPYLAAYATYRFGLAELNRERYEEAGAAFTSVLNDHPREAGCDTEAAFYRAIALGQARQKEAALVAAKAFLADYPDAPERYRKAMEQMMNELLQTWESPLYDLSGRMKHAAGTIENGDTGDKAQGEQKEILAIIEELIRRQEDSEGNQGGQGGGGGGGGARNRGQPNNPLNRSVLPGGAGGAGDLKPKPPRKPGDQWGDMREKEREEVLQSAKEKLPERYRELLEQYHKALAEGKRVTEGGTAKEEE